jgi:hypothetical protein
MAGDGDNRQPRVRDSGGLVVRPRQGQTFHDYGKRGGAATGAMRTRERIYKKWRQQAAEGKRKRGA